MDRGLGDAVHIDELRPRVAVARIPRAQALQLKRLAAEDDVTQREVGADSDGFFCADELPERGGRLVEDSDALRTQQPVECFGRARDRVGDHYQPPAVEQCAPQLPHGEIEGIGMEQGPDVCRIEAIPVLGGPEQPHDVGVGDAAALGHAGGAGGVNDVGQRIRN